MRISIALRCRPFSHVPGNRWVLPHTEYGVQVFPTRLIFFSLRDSSLQWILDFRMQGPVRGFTVQLDAEAHMLSLWGEAKDGYFKMRVACEGEHVALHNERRPLLCTFEGRDVRLERSASYALPIPCKARPREIIPRLSLGMHKAQEWEKIRMRANIQEFLPLWYRLGKLFDGSASKYSEGTLHLLERCRELVYANEKQRVVEAFTELFLAGMGNAFFPRLVDEEFQGILPNGKREESVSPMPILSHGARLIEALFYREEHDSMGILPCVPSQFHSGRITDVVTKAGEILAWEWTKYKLRRMRIASHSGKELTLQLPTSMKQCRMRTSLCEKGHVLSIHKGFLTIPSSNCMLDRFGC